MSYKPKVLATDEGGTGSSNSAASGKILIGDGTNFISSTPTYPNAAGTSGNVLTSNGTNFTSSSPSAVGSLVFIQSQAASNSVTIDFNTGTNVYTAHLFIYSGVVSATDATTLNLRVSTDGGGSYTTTGYLGGVNFTGYTSNTWSNGNATTRFQLTGGISNTGNADKTANGMIYIYNTNVALNCFISGQSSFFGTTPTAPSFGLYTGSAAASVNAFRFLMQAGNITSGTFTLYGIRSS